MLANPGYTVNIGCVDGGLNEGMRNWRVFVSQPDRKPLGRKCGPTDSSECSHFPSFLSASSSRCPWHHKQLLRCSPIRVAELRSHLLLLMDWLSASLITEGRWGLGQMALSIQMWPTVEVWNNSGIIVGTEAMKFVFTISSLKSDGNGGNLFFLLKYSWFTMLCYFQAYSRVIQLYICICI